MIPYCMWVLVVEWWVSKLLYPFYCTYCVGGGVCDTVARDDAGCLLIQGTGGWRLCVCMCWTCPSVCVCVWLDTVAGEDAGCLLIQGTGGWRLCAGSVRLWQHSSWDGSAARHQTVRRSLSLSHTHLITIHIQHFVHFIATEAQKKNKFIVRNYF